MDPARVRGFRVQGSAFPPLYKYLHREDMFHVREQKKNTQTHGPRVSSVLMFLCTQRAICTRARAQVGSAPFSRMGA